MQLYRSLAELPSNFGPSIATIGNFDGVHRGHQWVIDEVRARATELGFPSVAITFEPHPARVLRPDDKPTLITPIPEKLRLLAATGIDAVLLLRFTLDFSRTTARDFATTVLHDALHVRELHEGENFRFGYQAQGGIDSLEILGRELGFAVRTYAPRQLRGAPISSSRIRSLVAAGEVSKARALLGRPFSLQSTPASGRGYGTRFTVPTINLAPCPELVPGHGVYASTLQIGDGASSVTFNAVTNVGNRPTFGADSFTIESHLLDFRPIQLNEQTPLRLSFLTRLRDEIRWSSPEALREQIGRDIDRARRFFTLCRAVGSKHPSSRPPQL